MDADKSINILNRLLTVELRSLPQYLVSTAFWADHDDEKAVQTVVRIAEDQRTMANRISQLIEKREGAVVVGEFPMEYTDLHFLALDYLIKRLIAAQRRDIGVIRRSIEQLEDDEEARELAEEILGCEQAHLEALEELVAQPT